MANNAISSLSFDSTNNHVITIPYGSCSTAAGTAAKTVSVGNFSLETGAIVAVKFTTTNTASSPTLNVSSTGAKAIYYKGAAITASYLKANYTYQFMYNGTQWDLIGEIDTDTNTTSFTITANANDDDVVILTGTNGTNAVTYTASHATKGPSTTASTTKGATADVTIGSMNTGSSNSIKIPKVTTDKYGHTTGLTEQTLTITLPTAADLGLSAAMKFLGTSATAISDGATTNPITIGSTSTTATSGNVVLYSGKEYVWTGSAWEELGNEGSHALKTVTISAGGGLTGGGTLEANRTISHADTSSVSNLTETNRTYVSGLSFDTYGHVTGYDTATETVTDTHYTTGLTAGASGTTTNAATSNPYVKVKDNSTHRAQIQLKGSGATSVSSDANGVITISSTDTNTDTHYTANLYATTSSGTTNATTATSDPYLTLMENGTARNRIQIKGNGATTVSADDGIITITSTDTNTDTDTGATSVEVIGTGNAVTAASYDASTRKLTLTKGATYSNNSGDITGVTAGTGLTGGGDSGSVSLSLSTSGVTAGTYGPSANVTGSNNATISVPEITVDTYGRVTKVTNRTYTSVNTDSGDTKVTQAAAITTNGAYPVLLGYSTATTAVTNTVNKSSKMTFNPSTGQLAISGAASTSTTTGALKVTGGVGVSGSIYADSVYGAVWNDYAEYREGTAQFEPGRVICENGDDTLSLATERLQPGANIVSDTFGFAIGETEDAKTPIAVSGRVLAYPYEDRNSYKAGDAVCAAPNGTVSKMTREEIREYPERIIGTVSAIPEYETWGEGNVPVNGRIWIKIK